MYLYNAPFLMHHLPYGRENLYAPQFPEFFFPPSGYGGNGVPRFPIMVGFQGHNQTNPIHSSAFSLDYIFEDPLYSDSENILPLHVPYPSPDVPMNPYAFPPRPGSTFSLLESFKGKDGQIDFNKMISTAGQLMSIVNQVSGLVKGLAQLGKA